MTEPRWISLCAGLAATECRAMTGLFPPVTRIGGKRAVADHVLEIIGHPRPRRRTDGGTIGIPWDD